MTSNYVENFLSQIQHLPPDLVSAVQEWLATHERDYGDDEALLAALADELAGELQRRGGERT